MPCVMNVIKHFLGRGSWGVVVQKRWYKCQGGFENALATEPLVNKVAKNARCLLTLRKGGIPGWNLGIQRQHHDETTSLEQLGVRTPIFTPPPSHRPFLTRNRVGNMTQSTDMHFVFGYCLL